MMNAPAKLRAWRGAMNLTQQQAAAVFKCKQSTISKIEDGAMLPGRALAVAIKKITAQHELGAIEVEEWGDDAESQKST